MRYAALVAVVATVVAAAPAPCDPHLPVQVWSDVDDTAHSSGGGFLGFMGHRPVKEGMAGCDAYYHAHVVYPGFAAFTYALAKFGPSDTILTPGLMTARPKMMQLKKASPDVTAIADAPAGFQAALKSALQRQRSLQHDEDNLVDAVVLSPTEAAAADVGAGGGVKVIKHHQASAEIPSFALNIEGSRYGAATDFFPSILGWAAMVAVKVGTLGVGSTKSHRETAHKASHVKMGNTKADTMRVRKKT